MLTLMDHRMDEDQASEPPTRPGTADRTDFEHTRKGSMRHAVRKIFNRSSKTALTPSTDYRQSPKSSNSPSRVLTPSAPDSTEKLLLKTATPDRQPDITAYRTLSATMHVSSNKPTINKIRPLNAVEFPHSAKLKPLNLGNPFANTSEPQLRRRKTLPNGLKHDPIQPRSTEDSNAETVPPLPHGKSSNSDVNQRKLEMEALAQSQRRSRSAEDLDWKTQKEHPDSEKNAGLHQWQQSYPNSVLRSSGFTTKSSLSDRFKDVNEQDLDGDAHVRASHITQQRLRRSPEDGRPSPKKASEPITAQDTKNERFQQITSDPLGGRVSKLEAIMQTFQKTFDGLAVEQEKKAITAQNLEQSLYNHFATNAQSPIKIKYPPSLSADQLNSYQNVQVANRMMLGPGQLTPRDSAHSREGTGSGTPSPSPARHYHKSSASNGKTSPVADHTFKSLYEMLIDERSARRKLEQQVKGLSRELADLRELVAAQHEFSYTYVSNQAANNATLPASNDIYGAYHDGKDAQLRNSHELYAKRTSAFHPPITNKTYDVQVPRDANKFQFDLAPAQASYSQARDADADMF